MKLNDIFSVQSSHHSAQNMSVNMAMVRKETFEDSAFIISARFFRLQSSRAENSLRFFNYLGCDNKDIIIIKSFLLGWVG
jgi:hypothetical protein